MWKKCCKKDPPLQPSLEAWGRFLQAFQSFEGQHTARQHVKATRHARRTWLIVDLNQLLRPESDEMNITAIKTKRITSSAIEKRTGQSVPKGPKKFPHEPQNTVLFGRISPERVAVAARPAPDLVRWVPSRLRCFNGPKLGLFKQVSKSIYLDRFFNPSGSCFLPYWGSTLEMFFGWKVEQAILLSKPEMRGNKQTASSFLTDSRKLNWSVPYILRARSKHCGSLAGGISCLTCRCQLSVNSWKL